MCITSSAIYNNTDSLLLGILEEIRAYQVSLAKDLKELVTSQKVSLTPYSVQFRSDSLQMLVEAIGTLVSTVQAIGLVHTTGVVRATSNSKDEERLAYK